MWDKMIVNFFLFYFLYNVQQIFNRNHSQPMVRGKKKKKKKKKREKEGLERDNLCGVV